MVTKDDAQNIDPVGNEPMAATQTEVRSPNWEIWGRRANCCLWQAIALALNLDPDVKIDACRTANPRYREWERVAKSALENRGRPRTLPYDPDKPPASKLAIDFVVNLQDFAQYAHEIDWKVCDRFRELFFIEENRQAVSVESGSTLIFEENSVYYPEELVLAILAWKAVTQDSKPTDKHAPKDQIRQWLNKNSEKLTGNALSDAATERIATVCNWNKSGGAPRC